jgi:probable blue pigment (indigoidine) exporter
MARIVGQRLDVRYLNIKMMSMKRTALATVVAPVSWGTTYVTITELLPDGRPLLVALVRVAPAGLVLLAISALIARGVPRVGGWRRTVVLGLCNFGVFFPLLFVAVYRLPGGVAAAVGGVQPLLVLLLTRLVSGERPARRDLLVAVIAAVGVGLVVVRPGADIDPIGVLAAVGANISFSLGVVLTRRFPAPTDRLAATGAQLLVGAAVLAPLALLVEGAPPAIDAQAVAGFAYLSLFGTAVAYVLWFRGIGRLPTIAPPLLGLAAPITGAVMGWVVLGQALTPVQLVGFAVTLGAIAYGATAGPPASRSSGQDDGAGAEEEDTALGVGGDRTGQDDTLEVAADDAEVVGAVGMGHPRRVLVDDRALVEPGGHVVGGRPDHLHAPFPRLVVRPGAPEPGEEGVVDVDDPPRKRIAHRRRQHLHVAGEHHQLDLLLGDQGEQRGVGGVTGLGGDREVVEGHAVALGERAEVRVVRPDGDDVDRQLARPPAVQQVEQAVVVA